MVYQPYTNPMYLKKAQSEKPCLFKIPYDTSDPTNKFVPDREETLTLEKESISKLNKDLVKPYDYKKQNSLYENFKPASQEYHDQLAHANENNAISELKKLIEKCKGKSVETKFDKPFVVRQPNAQRIPKPSVLGKPTPFSDSLERKSFSKTKLVPKTNVSEGFSKLVTTQILPQTARQAIVQLTKFIVDSGCTKHMTGNLKLLCNFVEKYLGTVHFGNDQFALILGYEDLVQGTDPSSETKLQGRLLESFQEDAKYEHVGQDTRSQDGKDDKDKQGKDLKISESKTKSKDNDKG
ncbi:hypothetical protein Tco_1406740 [Tanacetum coccineum]